METIGDNMLSVLVRTATGKVIEVWLQEDSNDGVRELFATVDAGFLGKAKWVNASGQEER